MSKSSTTLDGADGPPLALPPIHPGEILGDELQELGLTARTFARALGVPANRVTQIVKGTRSITADTALRLARYFGTSPRFWLNLQQSYDLAVAERTSGEAIAQTVRPRAA